MLPFDDRFTRSKNAAMLQGFLILAASVDASPHIRGFPSSEVPQEKVREIQQDRQLLFGGGNGGGEDGGAEGGNQGGGSNLGSYLGGDGRGFCSFVEGLIDKGDQFQGNCTCTGDLFNNLTLACSFENACSESTGMDPPVVVSANNGEVGQPEACGTIDLSFTVTGLDGVNVSTCVDFANDEYLPTCFSYHMTLAGDLPDGPTCEAFYGDDECECEIADNFCLKVNCSEYLAGAEMDSCQPVNILASGADVGDLMPRFGGRETPDGPSETPPSNQTENRVDFQLWNITVPDWANIDWENLSWSAFIDMFNIDINDDGICPAFEQLIGMGQEFGAAGNCTCNGDLENGFVIRCMSERACRDVEQDDVCGAVSIEFTFDGLASVGVSVCTDFERSGFEQFCFTYTIPVADGSPPTCSASYDGKPCECDIEGLCLSLNCTEHLAGAATGTCQVLNIANGSDIGNFLPQLQFFDFNISDIDFAAFDSWADILDELPPDISVCSVVEVAVGITDAFFAEGDCECNSTSVDSFSIDCGFPQVCRTNVDGGRACGSVNVSLSVSDLKMASAEACVDVDGSLPEICLSFEIPITNGSLTGTPTCSASIGSDEKTCECSIDENLCFLLDCSPHADGAIMDTCQQLSLVGGNSVQNFIPGFRQLSTNTNVGTNPGDGVTSGNSGNGSDVNGEDGTNGTLDSAAADENNSGAPSASLTFSVVVFAASVVTFIA